MTKTPVIHLPFEPDLLLNKVLVCRQWNHAELGLVREATVEELFEIFQYKDSRDPSLVKVLHPNGDKPVWVRVVGRSP